MAPDDIPTVRYRWPWEIANAARRTRESLAEHVGGHFDAWGDRVRVCIGPLKVVRSRRAEDAQSVLVDDARRFAKPTRGLGVDPIKTLLGEENLLVSNGEAWRGRRRTVQPSLLRTRVAGYTEVMREVAVEHLQRLPTRGTADLHAFFSELTLDLVCRLLFALPAGPDYAALQPLLREVLDRLAAAATVPGWAPTPANLRFKASVRRLRAVMDHLIDERLALGRAALLERTDVLSTLCLSVAADDPAGDAAAPDDTGMRLTRAQIRDEVLTLFLAGHDTTSLALTWTAFELGRHRDVLEDAHAELVRGRDRALRDAALWESMRLYPPIPAVMRRALEPTPLGSHELAEGENVAVWSLFVHRHPEFWERPMAWEPARFLAGEDAVAVPGSYFPFGGGTRTCVGKHFALLEAGVILDALLERRRFDSTDLGDVRFASGPTLHPRGGLVVRLEPR